MVNEVGQLNFGVGFNVDYSALSQLKQQLTELKTIVPKDIMNLNEGMGLNEARSAFMKVQSTISQVETAYQNAFNPALGVANISKLNQSLNEIGINKIYTEFSTLGEKGTKAFRDIATQSLATNNQIKTSSSLLEKMGDTLTNTLRWNLASGAINKITGSIQEAYGYVKSLDSSLNDIQIVTGESAEQMDIFAEKANKAAKALGTTTTEYTKAALTFYQQGLGDEEASARATVSTKVSNVTGLSGDESAEYVTAVANGYQVAADEVENAMDKLAAVGAHTASNLAELSEGMAKVASSANAMGVSEDQLAATLSTVISVTRQDASSVGTAFKTIYARISDIETGAEGAETTLGNYTQAMADMGFNVLDSAGNLRDLGEVMEEIGGKWENLTKEQQVSLAQTMAGTRQYNNLIALFDNWADYEDSLNVSMSANGTLQEQQNIYMQSTVAHLEQLKAAEEGVFDSLIDSKELNTVIDGMTNLVSIVEQFIDGIGGAKGALLGVATVITKAISKNAADGVMRLAQNFMISAQNAANLNSKIKQTEDLMYSKSYGDEVVKAVVDASAAINQYYGIMSDAEKKEADDIIKSIEEYKQKEAEIKKLTEETNKYYQGIGANVHEKGSKVSQQRGSIDLANMNNGDQKNLSADINKANKELEIFKTTYQNILAYSKELNKDGSNAIDLANKVTKEAFAFEQIMNKNEKLFATMGIDINKVKEALQKFRDKNGIVNTEDFKELANVLKISEEQAEALANEMAKNRGLITAFGQAADESKAKLKEFLNNQQIKEFSQGLTGMLPSINSFAMGLESLSNISTIWNDDSLSNFQKFVQLTSAISIGIPSFVSGIGGVVSSFSKMKDNVGAVGTSLMEYINTTSVAVAASQAKTTATLAEGAAEAENTTYTLAGNLARSAEITLTEGENLSIGLLIKSYLKLAVAKALANPVKTGLVIGIAALSAGIAILVTHQKEYETAQDKANKKMKEAKSAAEQATTAYNEVKSAYDSLKSTISDYQSSYDAITTLTKGTDEWRDAIEEANQKALELMQTYPELASAISNVNGVLTLDTDSDAYKNYINQQSAEVTGSQFASVKANQKAIEAENNYNNVSLDLSAKEKYISEDNVFGHLSLTIDESERKALSDQIDKIDNAIATGASDEEIENLKNEKVTFVIDGETLSTTIADNYYSENPEEKNYSEQIQKLFMTNGELDQNYAQELQQILTESGGNVTKVANALKSRNEELSDSAALNMANALIENTDSIINAVNVYQTNADAIGGYTAVLTTLDYAGKEDDDEFTQMLTSGYISAQSSTGGNAYNIALADLKGTNVDKNGNTEGMDSATDYISSEREAKWYVENQLGLDASTVSWDNQKGTFTYTQANGTTSEAVKGSDITGEYLAQQNAAATLSAQENIAEQALEAFDELDISEDAIDAFKTGYTGEMSAVTNAALSSLYNEDTGTLQDNEDVEQLAAYFGEDWDQVKSQIIDNLAKRADMTDEEALNADRLAFAANGANTTNTAASNLITSVNNGDDAATIAASEDYENLKGQLETIKNLYPELTEQCITLNTQAAVGTDAWADALRDVQDAMAAIAMSDNINTISDDLDKAQEMIENGKAIDEEAVKVLTDEETHRSYQVNVKVGVQDEEYQELIEDITNNEYEIDVTVKSELDQQFDDAEAQINNIADATAKIGDNFIVAGSDVRELNQTFPGILENCTYLADGTIQLNQAVAKSAMESSNAEAESAVSAAVTKLQAEQKLLEQKKDIYDGLLELAQKGANGEIEVEDFTTQEKAKLSEAQTIDKKLEAQAEVDYSNEVAETTGEDAQDYGSNWVAAYQQVVEAAKQAAEAQVKLTDGVKNGEVAKVEDITAEYVSTASKDDSKTTVYSENASHIGDATSAEIVKAQQEAEFWAQKISTYQGMSDNLGDQINDIDGMIAELLANGTGAIDAVSDAANGGDLADSDFIDYLEEEIDKFHNVSVAIAEVEDELSKLQKVQDKLVGKDLIDNLNQQLGELEGEVELYQKKIDLEQEEADRLKSTYLEGAGARFDEDGTLLNYNEVVQNAVNSYNDVLEKYNQMNSAQQEIFKPVVEAAEKQYNNIKDAADEYEQIVNEDIPALEDKMQDATDAQIEIQIKKFKMDVELEVDMSDFEQKWNEFNTKIVKDVQDDDFFGQAEQNLDDINSYYATDSLGGGRIQTETDKVNEIMAQLKSIKETGTSSIYGDDEAQALADLKTYTEDLMTDLESVDDLIDDTEEKYLSTIDQADEELQDQADKYEYINDLIENGISMVQKLKGENAYDELGKMYEQEAQNNVKSLDFYRKEQSFWQEKMNSVEEGSEAWEKYYENWKDATDNLNSATETALDNLIAKYQNSVNQIFDGIESSLTGGFDLDYASEEWELIKKNADEYLDTVNSAYETQALQAKFTKAINGTDNVKAQKTLTAAMQEQLEILEKKDKLTQYDVDRANKMYDIAVKQAAFEEAQNNKSTMQLRRDSQGNYTYQYTSDEDKLADLEQELLEAQNALYNFDKDEVQSKQDEMLSTTQEYLSKMKDLYTTYVDENGNLNEEGQKLLLMYQKQYGDLINAAAAEQLVAKNNLTESAYAINAKMYANDADLFSTMTQKELGNWSTMTEEMQKQVSGKDGMKSIWSNSITEMITKVTGEGGLQPIMESALEDMKLAMQEYSKDLKEAGISTDGVTNSTQQYVIQVEQYISDNDKLIDQEKQKIEKYETLLEKLKQIEDNYGNAKQAAIDAATAGKDFYLEEQNEAFAATQLASEITKVTKAVEAEATAYDNATRAAQQYSSAASAVGSTTSGGNTPSISGDKYTYKLNAGGNGTGGELYTIYKNGVKIGTRGNKKSIEAEYPGITSAATGGYTGEWTNGSDEDNGKLAILHQKELVLNKDDTENILNTVDMVRSLSVTIDESMITMIGNLASSLKDFSTMDFGNINNSENMQQTVNIQADFPNATDSQQIQEAFRNLTNMATQYANKTSRYNQNGN